MTIPFSTIGEAGADIVLANANLVLPDRVEPGSLRVSQGEITSISKDTGLEGKQLDMEGDFLLPGLIEVHTDNLETQLLPRIDAAWPSSSAVIMHDAQLVAAGITTALNALTLADLEDCQSRADSLLECVASLDTARTDNLLRADHWLHLRCELAHPQLLGIARELAKHPRARLLSVMDHTPGQRQYREAHRYQRYYARSGVVWSEEEFSALVALRIAQQGRFRKEHLNAVTKLAIAQGLPIASHDDTSADDVRQAQFFGAIFSEFPTTLEAARLAHELGMLIVAGAPNLVRGKSHSGNVAAMDLARDNCLDVLSSDFVPASLLHGAFVLAEQAGWSLPRAVATVTQVPARSLGFADRGTLTVGSRADLIRVRRTSTHPVVIETWIKGLRCY